MRLSDVAHLHFDHTWGKIPVWVDKTHRNSLIIYLVASDLISKGEDVYHPDAGQDDLSIHYSPEKVQQAGILICP